MADQQKHNPFIEMEHKWLNKWYEEGTVEKYLHKNDSADVRFSFQDGPITANNPMGVHHAWGRTYKDLWQKFWNLQGYKQRFHNGFDCQGLWVEVEVEKELKLRTKKDIENIVPNDRAASIAQFVQLCKDRVHKFANVQTNQSKRLGYFMDWEHSYFTMSDENNYMIWHFLKTCYEHGWIYQGRDSVPWCPRCETAISQHEMLTEDYKEIVHDSIFFKLKIHDAEGLQRKFRIANTIFHPAYFLAWTTTPWTIPGNVALAVNTELTYVLVEVTKSEQKPFVIVLAENRVEDSLQGYEYKHLGSVKGSELIGFTYSAAFDEYPRIQEAREEHPESFHTVVDGSEIVTEDEGTGILHVAPGQGKEDFDLGIKNHLSVIELIEDDARYFEGLHEFSGKNAKKHPELIIDHLTQYNDGEHLFRVMKYKHRYPACWRCKQELVWKIADEWYISMDVPSKKDTKDARTLRERMRDVAQKITWMPDFGLDRELDWLKNMHDWLISKKNRYWGLSLPIWQCTQCDYFEVIGSKEELEQRAIKGWETFNGHSPHKPYIDEVEIHCLECKASMKRTLDVGNPWLDAGIVPFSTIAENNQGEPLYKKNKEEWNKWFPIDFITESFPGQFKNWFYSLIAMSTVLEDGNPFKRVLGFATLLAEDGRPMHKSWGNSIEFNQGADTIGVDVMRWMYVRQNPAENMFFGYRKADEVRRQFYLILWNSYKFYREYAQLDGFDQTLADTTVTPHILDTWIAARWTETKTHVENNLKNFDARSAAMSLEDFVSDISTWHIRRSRDRVGNGLNEHTARSFYQTLHPILVELSIVLSPFMPFLPEELYTSLTNGESVHLADWPRSLQQHNPQLISDMATLRAIVEVGHRSRKDLKLKVRQPLASIAVTLSNQIHFVKYRSELEAILAEELNVKTVLWNEKNGEENISIEYDTVITEELKNEGLVRELIREIQQKRKEEGLHLHQEAAIIIPEHFKMYESVIRKQVKVSTIAYGSAVAVNNE